MGDEGTVLSTDDGGATWARQTSNTDQDLRGVYFADARTGWAVGGGGAVLAATPRLSDAIAQSTDAESLRKALTNAAAALAGTDFRTELDEVAAIQRARAELDRRRTELAARSDARAEQPGVRAAADLAAAATDDASRQRALAALEVALARSEGAQDWWRYLADRVPAGVLILFLLATLGSLYRYNVRIAGFYHARADALELMALRLDREQFEKLSATLAADGVEFKDTRTPTDMATEITKAVIDRLDLKPRG